MALVTYLTNLSNGDVIEERGSKAFIEISLPSVKIVSIISVVILVPLVAMVYQLAGFHVMLITKGLTTYDYIVQENRKQKARRDAKAQALKEQRQKATRKTAQAMQLMRQNGRNAAGDGNSDLGTSDRAGNDSSGNASSKSSSGSISGIGDDPSVGSSSSVSVWKEETSLTRLILNYNHCLLMRNAT